MSNDLALYDTSGRRPSRRLQRGLAGLREESAFELARIDQQVDLEGAKIQSLVAVGQIAQQGMALLTAQEVQLAQMVPAAAARINAVSNMVAVQTVGIIADTARRLNR